MIALQIWNCRKVLVNPFCFGYKFAVKLMNLEDHFKIYYKITCCSANSPLGGHHYQLNVTLYVTSTLIPLCWICGIHSCCTLREMLWKIIKQYLQWNQTLYQHTLSIVTTKQYVYMYICKMTTTKPQQNKEIPANATCSFRWSGKKRPG